VEEESSATREQEERADCARAAVRAVVEGTGCELGEDIAREDEAGVAVSGRVRAGDSEKRSRVRAALDGGT
jgi:hypothetical protein